MKLNIIKKLLFVFALVLTTNAHSNIMGLESRDYIVSGDDLITYDKATGLEWLSLTVTAGLSMLEVEAISTIWSDGWQWATTDQMWTMLDRANDRTDSPPYEGLPAYQVAGFLGPTLTTISSGSHISKRVMGYSRLWVEPDGPYEVTNYATAIIEGYLNIDFSNPDGPWDWGHCENGLDEKCGDFRDYRWEETDTTPWYGAWLVRVPEPPAILLFGIGLVGLIGFRKCRKAA